MKAKIIKVNDTTEKKYWERFLGKTYPAEKRDEKQYLLDMRADEGGYRFWDISELEITK